MEGKIVTNMNNYKNSLDNNNCLYNAQNITNCDFEGKMNKYVQLIKQESKGCDERGRGDAVTSSLDRDRTTVEEISMPVEKLTEVQEFYKGKNVFITGATGFLGKILVEKLLRSCKDVENLYLLVRQKKGKDIYTRVDEVFDDQVFDVLKKEVPKFRHKVVVIPGDCEAAGLGLTLSDRQTLTEKVNIIFHVAATVKFDEHLRAAFAINVSAPLHVLRLARDMKHLNVYMHVSTAYTNCHLDRIEEKFYPISIKYEDLELRLQKLTDKEIDETLPSILGPWPNTYTFTKALAENELKHNSENLPLGILRPAIVTSTAKEPIPCWIDNMYGPTGVVVGSVTGVLRTLNCDGAVNAEIVPVDFVVNCLICSARNVHLQYQKSQPPPEPPIFNYVSSPENRITWYDFMKFNLTSVDQYPFNSAVWYTSVTLQKSVFMTQVFMVLLHILPALLMDGLALCVGQKPKLLKVYRKIHKFSSVLAYFCTHQITFTNDSTVQLWNNISEDDRRVFPFSMTAISWKDYFDRYIYGIRKFIFNESDDTLPQARRRWNRLYYLHQTVKVLFRGLLLYIMWIICTSMF